MFDKEIVLTSGNGIYQCRIIPTIKPSEETIPLSLLFDITYEGTTVLKESWAVRFGSTEQDIERLIIKVLKRFAGTVFLRVIVSKEQRLKLWYRFGELFLGGTAREYVLANLLIDDFYCQVTKTPRPAFDADAISCFSTTRHRFKDVILLVVEEKRWCRSFGLTDCAVSYNIATMNNLKSHNGELLMFKRCYEISKIPKVKKLLKDPKVANLITAWLDIF